MISENLNSVRQRIARCCEKINIPPEEITLVCVTKEAGIEEIEEVVRFGVKDIGENRVQDAISKYRVIGPSASFRANGERSRTIGPSASFRANGERSRTIGDKARWHLVGHLQTNKVKDAVSIFSLIHSVDSLRLADRIDREAKKINKIQDILIQVNTSGEKTKYGILPENVIEFLKVVFLYSDINIKGLMTIAPDVKDPELARPCFRMLRELRDRINSSLNTHYSLLSMGMSSDFEVAIEEGSNMVRIGRAIFNA